MYEHELAVAMELARTAGSFVLSHYQNEIVALEKIGVDNFAEPVTIADREASRIIVDGITAAFPDDAILSEEETDDVEHRVSKDRVWIIDPIDGTSGFIDKNGDFAIQIGFAVAGKPVVGVVLLPAHRQTLYASHGDGAFLQSASGSIQQLNASDLTDLSQMKIAVSRMHKAPKMKDIIRELGFSKQIERGSVGLKVGLIAEKVCDVYIHLSPRTKLWDTCAPEVIITEAGGKLTDLWGDHYDYSNPDVQNWGGIVAAGNASHQNIIDRIRPLLDKFGRVPRP